MTSRRRAFPQLELFQSRRPKHRGGRPPGPKPRVRHRRRPDFAGRHPGLVTLKVVAGLRTLRDVRIVRELEQTLAAACEQSDFRLAHYSIQADHLHLLVEADGKEALGRGMQ